ncbi:MAG TPA: zinc ribbon domain-containing protein [Gemmatimonadales bacterium]|nr:zinc ribbon domain-containing protein [Gemmatimonadales bacterium]
MIELILGILLAAGSMYFVLLPILRPPLEPAATDASIDEGDDPDDDMSKEAVALRALKEIEFDRATGKLSDTDYEQLKAKYTAEALAAMRGSGVLTPGASPGIHEPRAVARGQNTASLTCPEHGARPEPDAVFCSECGKRLGSAPGYCARCGTVLEDDARYCYRCGARVAA